MSNYPDNFPETPYDDGEKREYPTWNEISEIARRHLAPAFLAMAAEIQKAAPRYGHTAFGPADIEQFIDMTISDGLPDVIGSEFCNAVNDGV